MKEKERVGLDSFLRKMIDLMNSRFNKQDEIITKLKREISGLKGRITSLEKSVKLSMDETILKDLGFQSPAVEPAKPPKPPKAKLKKIK